MDPNITAIERAFELAKSGRYRTISHVKTCLKREGYFDYAIRGRSLEAQLNSLIREARKTADKITVIPLVARDFLARWTEGYVNADPRDRDTLDLTVALCFEDAERLGISKRTLTEIAGGDLRAHLERSLDSLGR